MRKFFVVTLLSLVFVSFANAQTLDDCDKENLAGTMQCLDKQHYAGGVCRSDDDIQNVIDTCRPNDSVKKTKYSCVSNSCVCSWTDENDPTCSTQHKSFSKCTGKCGGCLSGFEKDASDPNKCIKSCEKWEIGSAGACMDIEDVFKLLQGVQAKVGAIYCDKNYNASGEGEACPSGAPVCYQHTCGPVGFGDSCSASSPCPSSLVCNSAGVCQMDAAAGEGVWESFVFLPDVSPSGPYPGSYGEYWTCPYTTHGFKDLNGDYRNTGDDICVDKRKHWGPSVSFDGNVAIGKKTSRDVALDVEGYSRFSGGASFGGSLYATSFTSGNTIATKSLASEDYVRAKRVIIGDVSHVLGHSLHVGNRYNSYFTLEADTEDKGPYSPKMFFEKDGGKTSASITLRDKPYGSTESEFSIQTENDIKFKPRVIGGYYATSMTIKNSNGNVGIGTEGPGAKLEVNGNIIAKDPTADNHVATQKYVNSRINASSNPSFWQKPSSGKLSYDNVSGIFVRNITIKDTGHNNTATIAFDSIDGWHGGLVGLGIDTGISGAGIHDLMVGSPGYDVKLFTGNKVAMTIQDNRVGIGTTAPNPFSLLHISAGTSNDATLMIESDTDNNNEGDNPEIFFRQDGAQVYANIGLEGNAGSTVTGSTTNAFLIGSRDNDPDLQFVTNRIVRMTIDNSTGNVGIGTNSPGKALQVSGDIHAGRPNGNGSVNGYLGHNGWGVRSWVSGSDNTGGSFVYSTGGTRHEATLATSSYAANFRGDVRVNGVTKHTSDRRLKTNIKSLSGALEKVKSMRGVSFDWKDTSVLQQKQIGVIAQEVESLYPTMVSIDKETGYKSVDYNAIGPILIEAVKEQQKIIEKLESRLSVLEAK